MNLESIGHLHAFGALIGTNACLSAVIDAKTPRPVGQFGGKLADALLKNLAWSDSIGHSDAQRKALLKGFCDGIEERLTGMQLVEDEVDLPDTPEVAELLRLFEELDRSKPASS